MMLLSSSFSRACRMVVRRPWQPLVIALVIGLASSVTGILAEAVYKLLRPTLPFGNPARLLVVRSQTDLLSKLDIDRLRAFQSVAVVGAFRESDVQRRTDGTAESMKAAAVDAAFFRAAATRMSFGRALLDDDFRGGSSPGAVVSRAFAVRQGGPKAVIDRPITLDGQTFTIVGIAPDGFDLPRGADVWLPDNRATSAQDAPQYLAVVRLEGRAGLAAFNAETQRAGTVRLLESATHDRFAFHSEGIASYLHAELRTQIITVLIAVASIVLLTLGTLASVFVARLVARARIVAVERALGATTGTLFRQYLGETAVLGFVGLVSALTTSSWALRGIDSVSAIREWWPSANRLTPRIAGFTILASALFSLLLAGVQAIHIHRSAADGRLWRQGASATSGGRERSWRSVLLGFEIALVTCVLMLSAVLYRSFTEWDRLSWGYDVDHTAFAIVDLPQPQFRAGSLRGDAADRVRDALHRAPELRRSTVFALSLPAWASEKIDFVQVDGYERGTNPHGPAGPQSVMDVDTSYFGVFGISIVRGRGILQSDGAGTEPVIVIDETIAKRNWPSSDPIGHLMRFPAMEADGRWYRIVGVATNALPVSSIAPLVAHGSVGRVGVAYRALAQVDPKWPAHGDPKRAGFALAVRSSGGAGLPYDAIRLALASAVPDQPIEKLGTLRKYFQTGPASDALRKFAVVGIATAFGLILSLAGIVALVVETVARRTKEIGIRMALGARRRDVLALVVEDTSIVACVGVVIGLMAALGVSNLLGHYIFGIGRGVDEPSLLFGASTALLGVTIAISLAPAIRALRIDLTDALRAD